MTTPADWTAGDCLFVFGSLMDHDVLSLVAGMDMRSLKLQAATVSGYRQAAVAEESYPVLVESAGSGCNGLLIYGLTPVALERILFFEGEEYSLSPISVLPEDSVNGPVDAFYFRDAGVYSVQANAWSFETWQAEHKESFLVASREYMALFGSMTAAEADAHWLALANQSNACSSEPSKRDELAAG